MQTVAIPVRVFAALGARVMVATNAAGGVNAAFKVGDVMVIRDHISLPGLAGANPLVGHNAAAFGPRFPPLTTAYAPSLQALAAGVARERGLGGCLREGVYFHDSGPTYETPSEIAAMRALGGDAVGMSTAPEVVAAAHAGVAVLGLSLITNECRCVVARPMPALSPACFCCPHLHTPRPAPPPTRKHTHPFPVPLPWPCAARPATRACRPATRRCWRPRRSAPRTCRAWWRTLWRCWAPWG